MALNLNFIVNPSYSTTKIAIKDASTYPNDPPEVSAPSLLVDVPGFDTVIVPFVVNSENVLNSTILGITTEGEAPLPDGVYVFRYTVAPAETNFVEKTVMRVEQLQEKFDKAFMKLDIMDGNSKLKKQQKISLDTIYYFIQGAIAAANNCSVTEALVLYKKAEQLLYNFTEQGSCNNIAFPNNYY